MKSKPFVFAAAMAASIAILGAQTRITPPPNKYTLAQDVQLGREAAAEFRKQLPIMKDDAVTSYVNDLGRRLVEAIPAELGQPEFVYTFETVNVREINAFALPGGPMFLNRGMIEAAATEGEVAGVMAHEISHVALRHGTAQASKATKYQAGEIAGAVLGAIIGGRVGSVVAQGTRFGIGAAFMRFSREYEKQADLEGSQIMAAARYDPRDMANMFRTIEKQTGSNGPEWLSDHPNPGNRSEYITREAAALRVENPITGAEGFNRIKDHLRSLPRAPTTEEAARNAKRSGSSSSDRRPTGRVDPPSARYISYNEGNVFRISVPSNWQELTASNSVTFAPAGAYGEINGQNVFTHGIEAGLARANNRDLRSATDAFIDSLASGNPRLSQASASRSTVVDGRPALQTTLGNVSDVNNREEVIQLVTVQMRDGTLFYAIAVAPRDEIDTYEPAFDRVTRSIRLRN